MSTTEQPTPADADVSEVLGDLFARLMAGSDVVSADEERLAQRLQRLQRS